MSDRQEGGSLTIHGLQEAFQSRRRTPEEALEVLLSRIQQLNPSLNAYIAFDADALRRELAKQPLRGGRLAGVPITVKDNLSVKGELTTCGSKILAGYRAPYDATVIERLKQEGALIVPRANMDEFAFGSSTENSAYGPTRNPWNTDCVPGGSSGGSAASVAAGLAVGALGSDTGGSIRQPAAFCGVVGLKPTYGRVSRYGLVAFASSLDQIGPITRDVKDAAILLSVIAGHDPKDSTSAPVEVPDYVGRLGTSVKGLRIGVSDIPEEGLDPEVKAAVEESIRALERQGAVRVSVKLPHIQHSVATYYIVATAEASSNLARYDGVEYGFRDASAKTLGEMNVRTRTLGFGAEPQRRILLGTYVLSHGYYDAYYRKGMKVRTLIKYDFDEAFQHCDLVVMPTAPTPAFRIGEKMNDPLQMYLSDIYTICANLAGVPAISVPCGFSSAGLPIGLQLVAAPFREDLLLQAAYAYEQSAGWTARTPALAAAEGKA